MKNLVLSFRRNLLLVMLFLTIGFTTKASHLVGMDLLYTYVSGNTYKITAIWYGNCGAASASSFSTLPYTEPYVCIYDGDTYVTRLTLTIDTPATPQFGVNITPVCPRDTDSTQCTNTSYAYPGIKKFVYTAFYTLPHTSHYWRFLLSGGVASGAAPGRAAAITNLISGSTCQLIDTLDNTYHNNSSAILTQPPTPFFCLNDADSYNPIAVDPNGNSLAFALTPPMDGSGFGGSCPPSGWALAYATYTGLAWTGGPAMSATLPLQVSPGVFSFSSITGELDFTPNVLQRSVVVYNVRQYRNDTFIGTSQREMTFVVITCTNTPPTGTMMGAVNGTIVQDTDFVVCQNSGPFSFLVNITEPDPTSHIKVTTTGLPGGATMHLGGDSTNNPIDTIIWNSTGVAAGNYVFYLHYQDDHCPVNGQNIKAYSVSIVPVPAIGFDIISQNTCTSKGIVTFVPSGLGSPWNVYFYNGASAVDSNLGVTAPFTDSTLPPGTDTVRIFTHISNFCSVDTFFTMLPVASITLKDTIIQPTYCGATDGQIIIDSLTPGYWDTVKYYKNGVLDSFVTFVASNKLITISGLSAGIYTNITVKFGTCLSNVMGPDTLINPPFTMGNITFSNPTTCGVCNGQIVVHGLHPSQTDTLTYSYNTTPQPAISTYISTDSVIVINGLCGGIYANFAAHSGSCSTSSPASTPLVTPTLTPIYDTALHLGCKGDTLFCMNHSLNGTAIDSGLTYVWNWGDGSIFDTLTNPYHVYTAQGTYTITFTISNAHCDTTITKTITLNNFVVAHFTTSPNPVCQGNTVTFGNTSDGTNNTYEWFFGDGDSLNGFAAVHFYPHANTYTVTLIATNDVPCKDTANELLYVDTLSPLNVVTSDSVFCLGGGANLMAYYATEGNEGILWNFGDGNNVINKNPVMHSYLDIGTYNITIEALYRACPNVFATQNIHVIGYPTIYLGQDTVICPGGVPIIFSDNINNSIGGTHWLWSTGETSSSISVGTYGTFFVTVSQNGCSSSDTIVVKNDCYMDIPNVFSPNGDGLNDYFYPRQTLTKGLTTFKMDIYNRWGELVYESTNIDGRGWDGMYNNIPQPEGVYIYLIEGSFIDGRTEKHQGNITLIR